MLPQLVLFTFLVNHTKADTKVSRAGSGEVNHSWSAHSSWPSSAAATARTHTPPPPPLATAGQEPAETITLANGSSAEVVVVGMLGFHSACMTWSL